MNFSVEEENLICMYHTSDRRRTMARMLAALPDMDTEMRRLANGTIAKLERMTDADFDGQRFDRRDDHGVWTWIFNKIQ